VNTLAATAPSNRPNWPTLLAGAAIIAAIAVAALAALVWSPQGGAATAPLAEPGPGHWLGTDASGRDVLGMLAASGAGSLLLAGFAGVLSLLVAIPIGAAAALRGVPLPQVSANTMLPAGLLVGIVVSALSAIGNLTIIAAIALPAIAFAASATRQALAPLWAQDFVVGARMAGLGALAAAQRHVLPTLLPRCGALAAQVLGLAILLEVALSFAGLGTTAPGVSLGLMLREAQPYALIRPLLVIAPGLVVVALVLATKLVGYGLTGGRNGRA
jgi:peptide/nickel transport system permease protein